MHKLKADSVGKHGRQTRDVYATFFSSCQKVYIYFAEFAF